jgi:hypothetical protein
MSKLKKIMFGRIIPLMYMVLVVIMGGAFFWWVEMHEKVPLQHNFVSVDKPSVERLFIPIKTDVAKKLFAKPKVVKSELKVKLLDDRFTMSGDVLRNMLQLIDMRPRSMWNELKIYDEKLEFSADENQLTLGVYTDEDTNEEYVNVPAGLLRAYVE